jgi:hypothetical protein
MTPAFIPAFISAERRCLLRGRGEPREGPRSSGYPRGGTIVFRFGRFGRPEHVALPVDRVDQADGVAIVHLLTKLPDADGDGVGITLVVIADPLLLRLAKICIGNTPR